MIKREEQSLGDDFDMRDIMKAEAYEDEDEEYLFGVSDIVKDEYVNSPNNEFVM
jgi:hypothetical protein